MSGSTAWVCIWLFLILAFGTVDRSVRDDIKRMAATLERIEAQLGTAP